MRKTGCVASEIGIHQLYPTCGSCRRLAPQAGESDAIRFHDLRRLCAHCCSCNVHPKRIQELLGYTTSRYAPHLSTPPAGMGSMPLGR